MKFSPCTVTDANWISYWVSYIQSSTIVDTLPQRSAKYEKIKNYKPIQRTRKYPLHFVNLSSGFSPPPRSSTSPTFFSRDLSQSHLLDCHIPRYTQISTIIIHACVRTQAIPLASLTRIMRTPACIHGFAETKELAPWVALARTTVVAAAEESPLVGYKRKREREIERDKRPISRPLRGLNEETKKHVSHVAT